MWGNNNKVWMRYTGVLACDDCSALFLSRYIRFITMNRYYLDTVEVIDLQRYRIIKPTSRKLKQYVNEKLNSPFIFLNCNN